jgi:GT2 family glycosyltransferase
VKSSIAVLITCHNRREKTLQCLHALFSQKGLGESYLIEVFLVDDGCTDGTPEAIMIIFPHVNIIQGNGELYWNRGMHLAWETAVKTKDFDYYLWLNDDTFLFENTLENLFNKTFPTSIVCGATKSLIFNNATYGGISNKNKKLLIPNGSYQNADYCNGNCVLIPRKVFNCLGNLDPIFHHALGDFDYGMRARKKGIEIKVAPEFVGICEIHETTPKWRCTSLNIFERLKYLYKPISGCNPAEFFVFDKTHYGLHVACFHFFTIYLRCVFPFIWQENNCN